MVEFDGPAGPVAVLAFAPDGRRVAAGFRGRLATVGVWDVAAGRRVGGVPVSRVGAGERAGGLPLLAAFRPDGQLAVVSATGTVSLGDPVDPTRTLLSFDTGGPLTAAALNPSGAVVVSGPPQLRLVPLDGPATAWAANAGPRRAFGGVAFAPDGRLVVAVNESDARAPRPPVDDPGLRVLEPATGQAVSTLGAVPGRVDFLAWSPRGDRLAGLVGHRLWVWDAATGAAAGPLTAGGTGLFGRPAFHPSGRWLLAGGVNVGGGVYAWDAATGAEVYRFAPPVGPVHAVAVAADGLLAAAGGEGGKVAVWDLDLG